MKKYIKKILDRNEGLKFRAQLIRKITIRVYIVNFFFQRILRINSKFCYNINFTSSCIYPQGLKLSEDLTTLSSFALSGHCYFQALNGIILGHNVLFAPGVKIISANHEPVYPYRSRKSDQIIIGDNCWLGTNVVILPGVSIGNNCVIGAGSIVTKSFGDNLIIAGNPARVIKENNA